MNSCLPDLTYCPSARLRCELQVNSKKKDSARNKKLNIFHAAFSLLALTTFGRSGFFFFWAFETAWLSITFFSLHFPVFHSLTLENFQNYSCFEGFFLPNSVQQTQTLVFNKMPFMLFNYLSLCYSVLALPSAVTNDFNFPRVSVTGNKIPEISWLSRFSMTRTNPVPCFPQLGSWLLP